MARILGLVGVPPLPIAESINAFLPLAATGIVPKGAEPGHRDGWGFSGFSKERAVYFDRQSQPLSATGDRTAPMVQRAVASQSPILLGHLGKRTAPSDDISITQPFHYRDWVMVYDGLIFNPERLDIGDYQTQGNGDGERLLVWLVDQAGVSTDPTAALLEALRIMHDKIQFSAISFLLSDGKMIWAYRETSGDRVDKHSRADLQVAHGLSYRTVGKGWMLCSESLISLGKDWTLLPEKTLAAFSINGTAPQLEVI